MKQRIATTPSQARRLMGRGLLSTTADMSYTKRRGGVLTVIPYVRQASPEAWPAWSLSALLAFLCQFSFKVRVREWMSPVGIVPQYLNILLKWSIDGQWGMYLELDRCESKVQEACSQDEDPIEAVVQAFENMFSGEEGKEMLIDFCNTLEPIK